jgi:hypothetical protein
VLSFLSSFMIPGAHHDDKYRMVEDEFLSTAQRFTAHLHRAEYNRLKSIAKTQNAAAIREIERPVVGSPTKVAKQRREQQKRTLKQRDELGDEHGGSSSSRGGRVSSGLRVLMESPRKQSRSIRPFAQTTTNTRAAAGFASRGASPTVQSGRGSASLEKRQSDTDADEDLNAGAAAPRRAMTSSSKMPSASTKAGRLISTTPATNRRTSQLQSEQVFLHNHALDHDDHDDKEDDDDDPFGIRKRRIRREKSREQLRKTENPKPTKSNDVMPTFL